MSGRSLPEPVQPTEHREGSTSGCPSLSGMPTPRAEDALAVALSSGGTIGSAPATAAALFAPPAPAPSPAGAPRHLDSGTLQQLCRELDRHLPACDIVEVPSNGYLVVRRHTGQPERILSRPAPYAPGGRLSSRTTAAAATAGGAAGTPDGIAADPAAAGAAAAAWVPAQERRYQQQLQHLRLVVELRELLRSQLQEAQQQGLSSAPAPLPPPPPPQQSPQPQLLPQVSFPLAPAPQPVQLLGAGDGWSGFIANRLVAGRKLAMTWNPPPPQQP